MTPIALIIFLLSFSSISEQSEEVCLPVRRGSNEDVTTQEVGQQGRPGKVGPIGLPGPQGAPGPPGECTCDLTEVEALHAEARSLREQFETLSKPTLSPSERVNQCSVGVKNGRIRDEYMTSSSSANSNYAAHDARLDDPSDNVWVTPFDRRSSGEWIQVDLRTPTRVTGVVTQGRPTYNEWVSSYKIMTGNTEASLEFIRSSDGREMIFQGNRDRNSHVTNTFPQPIFARYFRLVVETWNSRMSMRIEYLTC